MKSNTQTYDTILHWGLITRLIGVLSLALCLLAGVAWLLQPSNAAAAPVKVGLISDAGGFSDGGFNAAALKGLQKAQTELGAIGTAYETTDSSQYAAKIGQCISEGNELCIGVGFSMVSAIENAANANPGVKFAVLDFAWGTYPANLRGIVFKSDESSYLAGTLAGLMTSSDVVAAIGGMNFDAVNLYLDGFAAGVQCANPAASVLITYTNSFNNPAQGAQVAQTLMARQADTIFVVAGPTGVGAILTATQSGAWGIGVDVDFFPTIFNNGVVAGHDHLLTSAIKGLDQAVFLTIQDTANGQFTSGTKSLGVKEGGAGIASFHTAAPFIPIATQRQVEQMHILFAGEQLQVGGACASPWSHWHFLPFVQR